MLYQVKTVDLRGDRVPAKILERLNAPHPSTRYSDHEEAGGAADEVRALLEAHSIEVREVSVIPAEMCVDDYVRHIDTGERGVVVAVTWPCALPEYPATLHVRMDDGTRKEILETQWEWTSAKQAELGRAYYHARRDFSRAASLFEGCASATNWSSLHSAMTTLQDARNALYA